MTEHFGKYELIRRIGVGGMAEVFMAKTHGPQGFVKEVVIKRILPAFNEDPDFVKMFIQEARMAARFAHANIVQIFDFDHVDGTYYIAMEWVDGCDIRRIQRASVSQNFPIPFELAIHVGIETLKGLNYAYSKTEQGRPLGIVHRDISPHNLLVSFAGEVKIADFGIAKAAALATATQSGVIKGKLAYMSPEQINGGPLDHRSDLFSLGIVLWELLAEKRLFSPHDHDGELLSRIQKADIPPLIQEKQQIPKGVANVVARLLKRDPNDRFSSAADALSELSPFSKADDALKAGAYVRQLISGGGEQNIPLTTQFLKENPPPVFREAAPNAETCVSGETSTTDPISLDEKDHDAESVPKLDEQDHVVSTNATTVPRLKEDVIASKKHSALYLSLWGAATISVVACFFVWWLAGSSSSDDVSSEGYGRMLQSIGKKENPSISLDAEISSDLSVDVSMDHQLADLPKKYLKKDKRKREVSTDVDPQVIAPTVQKNKQLLGILNVVVDPWARVRLQGKDLGTTPLRNYSITAGKYTLVLENPGLEKTEVIQIEIEPHKTKNIRRKWR